jgi:hypothetical protein
MLKRQREDFLRLQDLSDNLQMQLAHADEQRERIVARLDERERELAFTRAELERAQRDTADLAKQVEIRDLAFVRWQLAIAIPGATIVIRARTRRR